MNVKCIVIGGGAVGCAVAWRLAQRKLAVTLVERGPLGGEASWAAAGILAPQAEFAAPGPLFDLCLRSRELWPAFAAELGPVGYHRTGTLLAGGDPARHDWQRARGLRVEWRGGSLFLPDDHSVDPRLLSAALAERMQDGGVVVCAAEARRLIHDQDRVIGVEVAGEQLLADAVVVAAGAWSSSLAPIAEVRPLRGQILELRAAPGLVPHIVYGDGGYLVPRPDGRVLCGSSEDDVGFVKEVTAAVLDRLRARAHTLEPRLAGAEVTGSWAGLRPATADRLPLLGTIAPGLVIATAHHRNGILLAPLTAEIVAALVTGAPPPVDVRPFHPAREMHKSA